MDSPTDREMDVLRLNRNRFIQQTNCRPTFHFLKKQLKCIFVIYCVNLTCIHVLRRQYSLNEMVDRQVQNVKVRSMLTAVPLFISARPRNKGIGVKRVATEVGAEYH